MHTRTASLYWVDSPVLWPPNWAPLAGVIRVHPDWHTIRQPDFVCCFGLNIRETPTADSNTDARYAYGYPSTTPCPLSCVVPRWTNFQSLRWFRDTVMAVNFGALSKPLSQFRPAFRLMGSIGFSAFQECFISYGHLPGCIAGHLGWQSESLCRALNSFR